MKHLIVTLFIGLNLYSYAGNEVGGAGIAENNIRYAWLNLENFILMALNSDNSHLTLAEQRIVKDILADLPQEKKTTKIEFRDNKGDFFKVDGLVRIARTGYHVGDTIYFNTDLIYPFAGPASTPLLPKPGRPLDIPLAVGLLVHELGHHQGEKDHDMLDTIGGKINSTMHVFAQELDGGPKERNIIVTSYEYVGGARSELLLRDHEKILAIGDKVFESLKCHQDLGTPTNFVLWNLHWGKWTLPTKLENRTLHARVFIECYMNPGTLYQAADLKIELVIDRSKGPPVFLKTPMIIESKFVTKPQN